MILVTLSALDLASDSALFLPFSRAITASLLFMRNSWGISIPNSYKPPKMPAPRMVPTIVPTKIPPLLRGGATGSGPASSGSSSGSGSGSPEPVFKSGSVYLSKSSSSGVLFVA